MKVTVCFNDVRVVVPCGGEDFTVTNLISKAVIRYKKATCKPPDSWVTVHNLRQLDGGILDPDDCVADVADDREQIIAVFDEANKPQQGDGTSASDQSSSPDIFKDSEHKFEPFSCNDIEITGEALNGTPPPLYVRRGSEPALNRLSPIPIAKPAQTDSNKRWSAAPVIDDISTSTPVKSKHNPMYDDYPGERGEGSGAEKNPSSATSSGSSHHSATTTTLSRFSRDSKRCSVQILSDNPNMARWADAADRAAHNNEGKRREPLGGASTPTLIREPTPDRRYQETKNSVQLVVLVNDRTPLGIHVIPSTDKSGNDQGLLVEGIDPDGRVARDGTIQIRDIIIEINGQSLRNVTFHQAQEIFKNAMRSSELRLLVACKNENHHLIETHEKVLGDQSKIANVTSTNKVPSLSSRTQTAMLQSNTRRIGKRITVDLTKGQYGLGFSITTRDNPAGGEAPIYIKNILTQGAAIEDGNLRIGDRLLEVNGTPVTGYTQTEVANLLRQIPVGGVASLTVSRQEKASETFPDDQERNPDSPKLPRELPGEKSLDDNNAYPWKQREILTFDIPVHDSERAGLGVSVKGKTSNSGPNGNIDLGIFVKNVIHGGAASKDGRLRQNDQLVNINGMPLIGKSNSQSMKTLRTAMHQEGPIPGIITLTVARRLDGPRSGRDSVNSLGTTSSGTETLGGMKSGFNTPTPDQSGTSDMSDNTVVFLGRRDPRDGSFDRDPLDGMAGNPVIQRLTGSGKGNSGTLRNESYCRATHDTWNTSQLLANDRSTHDHRRDPMYGSPTVNPPSRETVMIHDEYDVSHNYRCPPNQGRGQISADEYNDQKAQSSDAYVSQSSLDEAAPGFSRDQFGRQSISEKRHATLDAKSTDTYQRSKKAREDREKHVDQSNNRTLPTNRDFPINNLNQSSKNRLYQKNNTLKANGLKALSKLQDFSSLTGSLTLQPRSKPTDQRMSLRDISRVAMTYEEKRSKSTSPLRDKEVPRTPLVLHRRSSKKTFGQDLSSIIFSWAASRNHSLLRQAPLKASSSVESLTPIEGTMHNPTGRQRKSNSQVGPGLGMRKSSSLESLQTMVQEMTLDDEGQRGMNKVPRGRGCNESFRAAVDRSYEAPLSTAQMETVAEEECESNSSAFGRGNSRQSSLSSADDRKKGARKNKRLLKGLGSMFRFGKHRKGLEPTEEDLRRENYAAAKKLHQEEHDRMQEYYKQMIENEKRLQNQESRDGMPDDEFNPSRSERMHQLRAEHQRRHLERKGTYPTDVTENNFDHSNKQISENDAQTNNKQNFNQSDSSLNAFIFDSQSFRTHRENKSKHRSLYVGCLRPMRESPPLENQSNQSITEGIRNLIIDKNVNHKPPLPPRNKTVNNNYQPPGIPRKSVYSTPIPNPKRVDCNQNPSFPELVGPNFSFTFNKPLSGSLSTIADIDAQNLANQSRSFVNNIENTRQNRHSSYISYDNPPIDGSLSSSGSTTSSNGSRNNSLPRMGLNGKTAAKRCPAPPAPPKGGHNPLAPLYSTSVLEQSKFWRLEPIPPEPKNEIQHIRSQSQDTFRSLKSKNRAPLQDPYQYSHYVNYEQIQKHLRKNKEQDRLAKLASQQYQDFRYKQTSREQREYQSQRSSREVTQNQRPVSNYFEYESVQAIMSRSQPSSLPRRPQPQPPNRAQAPPPNRAQAPPPNHRHNAQSNKGIGTRSQFGYQTSSRTTPTQENIYASSGFRPASHYPQQYGRTTPSISVPGSKV